MVLSILLLYSVQLCGSSQVDLQSLKYYFQRHQDFDFHPGDVSLEKLQASISALQSIWKPGYHEKLIGKAALTPGCSESFEYLADDPSRLVPLVDATGKPAAGLLEGNFYLVAAFDQCFSYNYTAFCYTSGLVTLLPKIIPWRAGLCVPKNCTAADVAGLINSTRLMVVVNNSITCTNSKTPSYSRDAIVMIGVAGLFAALVMGATLVDAVSQMLKGKGVLKSINSNQSENAAENEPLLKPTRRKPGVVPLDFIRAFSLFQTVPTLLATNQGPSVIKCLNGMRVISMTWVILGHTFAFSMAFTTADNPSVLPSLASRYSFQAVGNAYFSVDSFFFLSGVLVAYLTLREMKRKNGRFPVLHYYVHRYLRITPTYAFLLFFGAGLSIHFATGPYTSLADPFGPNCAKYWWTNLLYINNLFPWKLNDQCMGWGWYLANDMQFYIIAPVMIISAYYLLPLGAAIAGLIVLSGFTIDGVLAAVYDFQANELSGLAYKRNITTTVQYQDVIYGKPWDRISPYIVGLAMGYILYKNLKLDVKKKVGNILIYGFLWVVATFVACWLVYGLYFTWHGHIPTKAENVIYIMLSRTLWACCLGLVVYSCHNGYGWFVNSFLSMKFWTPLARMTFNAYLLHPIVIFVIYGQFQTPFHYTDITLTGYFIAFVVISYAAAAIVCVAVEFPLGTIEMLLFKLCGLGRQESQRHNTVMKEISEA